MSDMRVDGVSYETVAAQPGWYVLEAFLGDSFASCLAFREPIIAWQVRTSVEGEKANSDVEPITVEGVQLERALLRPDGKVVKPYDAFYDDVSEWLRDAFKREKGDIIEQKPQSD